MNEMFEKFLLETRELKPNELKVLARICMEECLRVECEDLLGTIEAARKIAKLNSQERF